MRKEEKKIIVAVDKKAVSVKTPKNKKMLSGFEKFIHKCEDNMTLAVTDK